MTGLNRKTFQKRIWQVASAIVLPLFYAVPTAIAATNGTLGPTSTGTAAITLTIPQQYQISGVTDLALGTWSGSGNLAGNADVCVYTNDATTNYHVLITDNSTMSTTGFVLQNAGATADIPFAVNWNSAAGTTGNQPVTYNTPLAGTGANTTSTTCGGVNDADFQVTVLGTDLAVAPSGAYSTTLSIAIEP